MYILTTKVPQGATIATFTYNQADADSQNFTWDQPEEKSGMSVACNLINKEVT